MPREVGQSSHSNQKAGDRTYGTFHQASSHHSLEFPEGSEIPALARSAGVCHGACLAARTGGVLAISS